MQSRVRTRAVDHERIRQFSSRVPGPGSTVLTRCRRTYFQTVSTMTTESGSTQKVTVFPAGVGARSAPMLNDYLRKRGCEIAFASSCKEVQRMLRERHHDWFSASLCFPTELHTSLWHAFRTGPMQPCFFSMWSNTAAGGSTPFLKDRISWTTQACDPAEFRILLDEILFARLLRDAKKLRRRPQAHRCDNGALQVHNEGEVPCEEPILVPRGGI
jgi:hypothetical protein